jgi:hypothetical protein
MLLLFLLLTVSMPRHVQGQAAVIDAANLVQNTIAAIKTTVMVVNQLLELEGLGSIVLDAGFAEDLTTLGEIGLLPIGALDMPDVIRSNPSSLISGQSAAWLAEHRIRL